MDVDSIVKTALFEALGQETRDKLVRDALDHVIAPQQGSYGSRLPSPLQLAFEAEVRRIAAEQVRTFMAGDAPEAAAIRAQVRDLVVKGWEKAMADPEKLTDRMAAAITSAFTPER